MRQITVKQMAHLLKEAKNEGLPQPIFFLGAGASASGNIPTAKDIIKIIQVKYLQNPFICEVDEDEVSYARLMRCLSASQRKTLLKELIDKAKINVTHIYLAQLLKEDYVDYILTVNFDNLMLRALALFNTFPPTYDLAILNDLTTSTIEKKSVVYLHGQHYGQWLLNTNLEMDRVRKTVNSIFRSITDRRPWVFIGYSGSDPIFEDIKNLGWFDNRLYWVGYKDEDLSDNVKDFLKSRDPDAFYIKGYDADSFMLKLNNELGLKQPDILENPFTSLEKMLLQINDIDDDEHFKGVKTRLEIALKNVKQAVYKYEKSNLYLYQTGHDLKDNFGDASIKNIEENNKDLRIDSFRKNIVKLITSEDYDENIIVSIEASANELNDKDIDKSLSLLYLNWADHLSDSARVKTGVEAENLYKNSFLKYQRALDKNPELHDALYNWANNLAALAESKSGKEADDLFQESFIKYSKAFDNKPDNHKLLNNWGANLLLFAESKLGKEAEKFYKQAIEKFQESFNIKPDSSQMLNNWGASLLALARIKTGAEADELYQQSFEKYQQATEIDNRQSSSFVNWAIGLIELANMKADEEADKLYQLGFLKYKQAQNINPDNHKVLNNWGVGLLTLAQKKSGQEADSLYHQAFEKIKLAHDLSGDHYNLACWYALNNHKDKALIYLEASLENKEIKIEHVLSDKEWLNYLNDKDFNLLISKYRANEFL